MIALGAAEPSYRQIAEVARVAGASNRGGRRHPGRRDDRDGRAARGRGRPRRRPRDRLRRARGARAARGAGRRCEGGGRRGARPNRASGRRSALVDTSAVDVYLVVDVFLLLLIGVGPKIALVPFLEVTDGMDTATRARVTRKMLTTAAVVALLLVTFGELLRRLLHFSTGALSVAGGIILFIIAVTMIRGPGDAPRRPSRRRRDRSDAARGVPAGGPLPAEPGRDRRARDPLGGRRLGRLFPPWSECSRSCSRSTSPCSGAANRVSEHLDASRML